MIRKRIHIYTILSSVFLMLVFGFSNCSNLDSSHELSSPVDTDQERSSACKSELETQFAASYRPLLMNSSLCLKCHSDSGVSPYKLAAADRTVAFSAFMAAGVGLVDQNALSSTHAPGITGAALQSPIDEARAIWNPAYTSYQSCLATEDNPTDDLLTMVDKSAADLYFGDGRTVILSWDLSSSEVVSTEDRFPAVFSVDVRIHYNISGGQTIPDGYVFSNPRIKMLTGDQEVSVEGIIVHINGAKANAMEPFLSATQVARGIDDSIIYQGEVVTPLTTVSNSDKFGISFGYFELRSRTDNPPVPPTPSLRINDTFANATTAPRVSLTISGDSTSKRWCLTSMNTRPASAAAACPGYESSLNMGWVTVRPTSFDLTKIGHLVQQGEVVSIYLWVLNSDLKMNLAAAIGQVTYDSVAPTAPTLGAISLAGNTQIADIISLGDYSESVSWCVKEGGSVSSVNTSANCKFSTSKPSLVGLTSGGDRHVAIYVRDLANNISPASPITKIVNPYGKIAFNQLTTLSYGARAVFANNCLSCHGPGGANVTNWNSTAYAETITTVKRDAILKNLNSTTASSAHLDLVTLRDSALVQMWFSQTPAPQELVP